MGLLSNRIMSFIQIKFLYYPLIANPKEGRSESVESNRQQREDRHKAVVLHDEIDDCYMIAQGHPDYELGIQA